MIGERGLTQRELCELMGWDYRAVAQAAKRENLSTHAFVIQKTGWRLCLERYYPPTATLKQNGFPQINSDEIPDIDLPEAD
jgi:hypothetical protein